jgi:putative flavoprotein involved in K+ transport
MATGLFQQPRIPAFAGDLPEGILQLASGQYRNPQALPPGAVLVAGSGQSGCQIAEELYQSGRKVYLNVGSTGRVPRRYRGQDIVRWMVDSGFMSRTAGQLPSSKARFAGNPHVTGKSGGHNLNLHQFARDGVVLLGRALNARGATLEIAPDLKDNLAKADRFEAEMLANIDRFIDETGRHAPHETLPQLHDGYRADVLAELDLAAAGITTVIWALSYTCDFSLVRRPVCDGDGYPIQSRGVTEYPGLYFVGLPWLTAQKSGVLLGVGEDAAYIAAHIAEQSRLNR